MRKIIQLFSYLFHPIAIPTLAILIYFLDTYIFFKPIEVSITVAQVFITTFLIPVATYVLLRSLRLISSSIMVSKTQERIIPITINIALLILLKEYILKANNVYEFDLFITALSYSYIGILISLLLGKKLSIHICSLTALVSFYILLSLHFYHAHLLGTMLLILSLGATASSRLVLKSHTNAEILLGMALGLIPQLYIWTV